LSRLPDGQTRAGAVVVDFDGTITVEETLDALVERFGDADAHRNAVAELGRSLTLYEVIARGYGSIRATRADVLEWLLETVRFRYGFSEFVRASGNRGWRVIVISSGVRELIEPLLEREGLAGLEVIANELEGDEGWRVVFRETQLCAVCHEPCKRAAFLDAVGGDASVYVGDGYSDGCAAAAADIVYARRRLPEYLDERGLPYRRFSNFRDIDL
jgi:2-hydroxy-3-keto-5-methylthiopentenyl-1-phosphate phosphatase